MRKRPSRETVSEVERALRLTPWEIEDRYPAKPAQLFQTAREELGDETLRQAAEVHRLFARRPELRAQWEPRILAGEVTLAEVLAAGAE